MSQHPKQELGVVVIGRNEGDRLKRCLRSLAGSVDHIVYVDSGSTDGSVEFAKSLGVDVVDLDMDLPFTMPRGRNAGFERLRKLAPEAGLVQFVDGDCTVAEGWIDAAQQTLAERDDIAVVCGRRRERHPDASIYNRICDIEWNGPLGEVAACGGDSMMRTAVFAELGGFDPGMIAGEEAELCLRIRRLGWKILRIDEEMTLHDAAIFHFSQWWSRSVRCGHAYAEGAAMHGRSPERHNAQPVHSFCVYGAAIPSFILACFSLSIALHPILGMGSIVGACAYPTLWWRVRRDQKLRGNDSAVAGAYAMFCVLAKFAQFVGGATFWSNRIRGRRTVLLEYKQPASSRS